MISPASFALAYALDWLIGGPTWLPHPVRWMGRMITGGETLLRRFSRAPSSEFIAGTLLTVIVVGAFGIGSWIVLLWLRSLNPALAFVVSRQIGRAGHCPVAIRRLMSQSLNTSGRMILLLGGARAGKSTYAMRLVQDDERASGDDICFIATAQGLDEDMTKRIARHRAERPTHWRTIEEPYQIDEALRMAAESEVVVVDCLTLFVSNWLMRYEDEHECEQFVRRITRDFLAIARTRRQTIICVSNEVGLGVVPDTNLGRVFRDLLGRVNQEFAAAADEVYLIIAGLPLQLKPAT